MSKFKKVIYSLSLVLILISLGAGYFFSSEIIAFRIRSLNEDQKNLKIKDIGQFGLPEPKEFEFKSGEILLKGWYFHSPKNRKCGAILLHGHTGTRFGGLKYAPLFWKRGCDIFVYDARHHGESEGDFGTYGYYEKKDLDQAVNYFSEISGLSPNQIGILGESYGAATALQLTDIRSDLAFVIAESSYRNMKTIIEKRAVEIYGKPILFLSAVAFQIAELRANFLVRDVSPIRSVERIYFPVMLIHSKTDEFTPYEDSVAMFELIPSKHKKIFITVWGATHARSIDTNYKAVEKEVDVFLGKDVKSFGSL